MSNAIEMKSYIPGLSHSEAKKRLQEHGPNTIRAKKRKPAAVIFLEQFADFMVVVLLLSTAVSAFMGELSEAVTIAAIVVVNAILGFIQSTGQKNPAGFKNLAAPKGKVIRGAEVCVIPRKKLFPGMLSCSEEGTGFPRMPHSLMPRH